MIGKTVLIIDSDTDLLHLASHIFQKEGAQTITASREMEGMSKLFTCHPDLIVLDVVLPGADGFEICRKIRQVSGVPLIILTALNGEQEMLQGLEAGADDFLSKPFNAEILVARARAVLRRSEHQNNDAAPFKYNDGNLSIDIENHHVLIKGRLVKLTRVEFRLLVYLARNAGKVLTFNQILSAVWGDEYRGNMEYVHIYISHLRRKLEENTKSPRYFLTVHGVGYIFESQELLYK
ncbi:MAG: response regulator transcription factor [Chloroflexi bacterium]|nr:response regulator transcription factor [Chloroflexota bacterium]